jgi:hypothetical protein
VGRALDRRSATPERNEWLAGVSTLCQRVANKAWWRIGVDEYRLHRSRRS